MLEFFEIVTKAVDKGKSVDSIFLDIAKAFNKVLRKRLINKLKAYGVRGWFLRKITNCLDTRKQ